MKEPEGRITRIVETLHAKVAISQGPPFGTPGPERLISPERVGLANSVSLKANPLGRRLFGHKARRHAILTLRPQPDGCIHDDI